MLHESDPPVDDHLGTTHIEAVAAAPGQILELPAGLVLAKIEPEALFLELVEQRLVDFARAAGEILVRLAHQRHRHRDDDLIALIERRPFVVERIRQLRARLDIDDERRAALDDGHLGPRRAEVLGDVMPAIAGAEDDGAGAGPILAVGIFAGVEHPALEAVEPGDFGPHGNAADAGRHDEVARVQRARAAIRCFHRNRPIAHRFVIGAADKLGSGPDVQLHRLGIGLEPAGQLVLGDVGGPVRRERHVGQVVDLDLVVQRQRVVAQAPIIADPLVAVDPQGIDAELGQPCGDREPRLPAADDQDRRVADGESSGCAPLVQPVGPPEIPGMGLPGRPAAAGRLLVALNLDQFGRKGPSPVRAVLVRAQPHNAPTAADFGLEDEEHLDHLAPDPRDGLRRDASGVESEAGCLHRDNGVRKRGNRSRGAAEGLQVPGQRQNIAPVGVGEEQIVEAVMSRRSHVQPRQPRLGAGP